MKRWLLRWTVALVAMLAATDLSSQNLQIQLVMSPNPSPYLSDWEQRQETAIFRITNLTTGAIPVKIETKIFLDGELKAETKTPDMPVIVVGPGTSIYNAEDILPLQAVKVHGDGEQTIVQAGKIPAGVYRICTRLVDPELGGPLTEDACAFFTATSYQLPSLLLPENGAVIGPQESQRIVFTWTPVVPSSPIPPLYIVRVFEVLPGLDPIQAFQGNRPILEAEVQGNTQLLWPPDVPLPEGDRRYVWNVQTLDPEGRPIADPNGFSEPFTFSLTTGDHTTEVPCRATNCAVRSIRAFGLNDALPANASDLHAPMTARTPIAFVADVTSDCPSTCPMQVQGTWNIRLETTDGAVDVTFAAPDSLVWTPPTPGRITVEYTARVTCGPSSPVTCEGTGVFQGDVTGPEITGGPTPDTIRVPSERTDTLRIPVERPPDTTITRNCVLIPPSSEPATPISLGMILDRPTTFEYPRAVPIRADAIDEDYAVFRCRDCDGTIAELRKPTRDDVRDFTWKLTGKGSLNDPFSLDSISLLDDSLAAIDRRLEEIETELEELKADTAALRSRLEKQQADAQRRLDELDDEAHRIDSTLTLQRDSLTAITDSLRILVDLRAGHVEKEKAKGDSVTALGRSVDSLNTILRGDPTAEESAKLDEVVAARKASTLADSSVAEKRRELQTEAERLQSAIATAAEGLRAAGDSYESLKRRGEEETKKIADFQSVLYGHPKGRAYFTARRSWDLALTALINSYIPAKQIPLGRTQNHLDGLGERILAAPGMAMRTTGLATFKTDMSALLAGLTSDCAAIADTTERSACAAALLTVTDAATAYTDALEMAALSHYRLDPAIRDSITAARTRLISLEGSIRSAAKSVERKSADYEAALTEYTTTIDRIESELSSALDKAAESRASLATLEAEYQTMIRQRESDLEQNRERYLREKHDLEGTINTLALGRELLLDSIAMIDHDTIALGAMKARLERMIADLEKQSATLKGVRSNLETILALKLDDMLKPYLDRIAALEKEAEDLRKKHDDAKKKREMLAEGTKEAHGPIVYYIPPPLEEILKDKARFEELKDSVAKAEQGVADAKSWKGGVQAQLTRLLERIARELTTYKSSEYEKKNLEEEKDEADKDLKTLQNNKTMEYQEKQAQLEDLLDRTEINRDTAEAYIRRAQADSTAIAEMIDRLRETIVQLDTALSGYRESMADAQAQLDYEENLRTAARTTLQSRLAELQNAKRELEQLANDLARAQNDYTRAVARSNQRREGGADAAVRAKQAEVETQKTKVTSFESGVASAASSFKSAEQRVSTAADTLFARSELFRSKGQELRVYQDSLVKLNERMEEVLSGLRYWRMVKEKAEDLIDRTNAARREFQDTVANLVDNDDEVKSNAEKVAEIEKGIDDATGKMEKAEKNIEETLRKRDDLLARAKDTLEAARRKLEDAKIALREFLLEEFRTVTLDVKLTLEAQDVVLDGYRADDPKAELVNALSYLGSRTPTMTNILPTGGLPELRVPGTCIPMVSFAPPSGPTSVPPSLKMKEPRTIALIYKRGEPLWPEWPVIPDDAPVLTKDVVALGADGSDGDMLTQACASQQFCPPPKPFHSGIADLMTYEWSGDGTYISGTAYRDLLWETPDVPKPDCMKEFLVETKYHANMIAGDPELKEKMKPEIAPGVLIETPDTLIGIPKGRDTVRARIVKGDHTGRAGEDVEFAVTLIDGQAKGYGFGGTDTVTTTTTDGDGYANALFDYGEGFAAFRITVEWKRHDECRTDDFIALSPLYLQFLRFTSGASTVAWDAAKKIWSGTPVGDVVKGMPEGVDSVYAGEVYAVAGYQNDDRDSVDGVRIGFTPQGKFEVKPDSVTTELFGIGRTVVHDPPEKGELALKAGCEKRYRPLCNPPDTVGIYNTSKIEKFRIGSPDDPFVIVPDQPPSPGEPVNGTGKLEIAVGGMFILSLKDLALSIDDVALDERGDEIPVALSGSVSWKSGEGEAKTSLYGFDISLDSIVIRAGYGAGIGGSVAHAKLENPVSFYAEMNTAGEFYGEVASMPKLSIAGFTLKDGTSFAIDMHDGKSDKGLPDAFKGIVIRAAALELPSVFNGRDGAPSTISVSNFRIGTEEGFAGTVALEGSFFKIGYAGYEFGADKISLTFAKSALAGGEFTGTIALPSPMEGKLRVTVGRAGEEWKASVTTDNPVSIPRLETVFSLRDGTGITWDEGERIGTLRINAVISSTKFGDMDISGFEFNSRGEIKADNIGINKAISFGRNFTLHVESLSFNLMGAEYGAALKGGFAIPAIGIDKLDGTATVGPGPEISVTLEHAELEFTNGPVEFKGELSYTGNVFRGAFDIGIRNLAAKPGGIKGTFIVGNQPIDEHTSYTYWYVEMSLGVSIPLGQTGLSLLELGGGVGWNYDPPIGTQEGSPRNTEALAFKAIVGVGNTPSGQVFAGRLTMALASGRFTVNGKAWLLQKEESMFGEGQLGIYWDPVAKLDGYVRMLVGVPDAEGEIFYFNGKVDFLYSSADSYIRSETITGSVLKQVNAEAHLDVTSDYIRMDGRMWYDLNKKFSLGIVAAIVDLHISVDGKVDYSNVRSTLDASLGFHGDWDVNLETPVGTYDIIAGSITVEAKMHAAPGLIAFEGTADISYSVLWYSGSEKLDVGFTGSI